MKTRNQIKGTSGVLVVNKIINNFWESDWQAVDQENDDAIDGIIHVRKGGELTGEIINAQVKSGDGYIVSTNNRPDKLGVNVGKEYIRSHRPRWNALQGAVILIFVADNEKAYWCDLKSEDAYCDINKSIILVNKNQRFGSHSKGQFKKIGGLFLQDRNLPTISLNTKELSYLNINYPIKKSAREYYKAWSKSNFSERTNPGLGEVIVNRSGWRHISRTSRGYDKVFQSWQLLCAARKIIQTVNKAYQITKQESTSEIDQMYVLKDFISLRAKVVFPNRHESVVQVILRRKKVVNMKNGDIEQKVWFYSVYEPRRGIRF